MPMFLKYGLLLLLVFAEASAEAMPIGVKIALNGRAAAQEAVNAVFPVLDGEVSAVDIAEALAEAEDEALAANIKDADGYAAFREWAKGAGATDVRVCGKAWLSYALGADRLITKGITSNDVHIAKFEMSTATGGGAMGSSRPTFAFEVAIDNVNIGGGMVAVETLKENLKKVLGIEGAATLSPDGFSSENVDFEIGTPKDGKATFTAKPRDSAKGDGGAFFMRVRVKQ